MLYTVSNNCLSPPWNISSSKKTLKFKILSEAKTNISLFIQIFSVAIRSHRNKKFTMAK